MTLKPRPKPLPPLPPTWNVNLSWTEGRHVQVAQYDSKTEATVRARALRVKHAGVAYVWIAKAS